ncbi:MAG: FkbM family methyltransferase [Planctomycetes bacterium]|nr:FkbM family methyltransferase [Planctomycetota bacterium]
MATLAEKIWDVVRLAGYCRRARGHGGWVEVRRQKLRWRLRPERFLDRQILLRGAFEPKTTQLVRRFVRPGMRVLDVGANIGYFTTIIAGLVGPQGRVWAFEPVETYRQRLIWHLDANGLAGRAEVFDYGLSDRQRSLEIVMEESTASLHPTTAGGDRQTVQLRRLDDIAGELRIDRIDLIKIDIDGHEPFFLAGAQQTIRKHRPVMVMEFNQASLDAASSDVRRLYEQLTDLGYQLYSEKTGQPFQSRLEFLRECGNFRRSANAWAYPQVQAKI